MLSSIYYFASIFILNVGHALGAPASPSRVSSASQTNDVTITLMGIMSSERNISPSIVKRNTTYKPVDFIELGKDGSTLIIGIDAAHIGYDSRIATGHGNETVTVEEIRDDAAKQNISCLWSETGSELNALKDELSNASARSTRLVSRSSQDESSAIMDLRHARHVYEVALTVGLVSMTGPILIYGVNGDLLGPMAVLALVLRVVLGFCHDYVQYFEGQMPQDLRPERPEFLALAIVNRLIRGVITRIRENEQIAALLRGASEEEASASGRPLQPSDLGLTTSPPNYQTPQIAESLLALPEWRALEAQQQEPPSEPALFVPSSSSDAQHNQPNGTQNTASSPIHLSSPNGQQSQQAAKQSQYQQWISPLLTSGEASESLDKPSNSNLDPPSSAPKERQQEQQDGEVNSGSPPSSSSSDQPPQAEQRLVPTPSSGTPAGPDLSSWTTIDDEPWEHVTEP